MAPKPFRVPDSFSHPGTPNASRRSVPPAGLCWEGQRSGTRPLLHHQISLISEIKMRHQGVHVAVCNKSSCYPFHSHVAVLVNQDVLFRCCFSPLHPSLFRFLHKALFTQDFLGEKLIQRTEGGEFPHRMGKEGLCWKLNPYEYSNTALLPALCRKPADA